MSAIRRVVFTLAAAGCVALIACSGVNKAGREPKALTDEFISFVRLSQPDYEPADTPEELAKQADLVVSGEISGVERGQSYAPTASSEPVIASSVIVVRVEEVLSGDGGLVVAGTVYIELPHPAFVGSGDPGTDGEGTDQRAPFDHSAFAATVPIDSKGVFFLEDVTAPGHYWDTVIDEGAGRPQGAPLMAPFPQGFLVETQDAGLVSMMEPFDSMPAGWHGLSVLTEVIEAVP